MQINRLMDMIYILLDKRIVTAKELAERFGVSQRTIYRDIDVLSSAGIPVYTNKGKGGGISLLDNFVLNKAMITESEQMEILTSLQSLKALSVQEVEPVLHKLAVLFGKNNTSWIDVDLSRWGNHADDQEVFQIIKTGIFQKRVMVFVYYGANGEKSSRSVEPIKLIFKRYDWYLYAFCEQRNDYRLFKISRIQNLALNDRTFTRIAPDDIKIDLPDMNTPMIRARLKVHSRMAFRIFDEFSYHDIDENPDGSLMVTIEFPDLEWLYGYILSFGGDAQVIAPEAIRQGIKKRLQECLDTYKD